MTSDSAGAVMKLPRRVYSRNSEASVSNDGKIQGFVFVSFLFLSSVIKFHKKCANSTQRSQSHITFQPRYANLLSSKITQHDIKAMSTRIRKFFFPQIFFCGCENFRIHKFSHPHAAYSNRFQPSTRIR